MSLKIEKKEKIEILDEQDVVKVRMATKKLATEYKFKLIDETKLITAVSELGRNTLVHGGGGIAIIEVITDYLRTGIRACFIDKGKGITDVDLALTDKYTTGTGLGLGLGAAKRLSDEFYIESKPNEGTKVTIIKWK